MGLFGKNRSEKLAEIEALIHEAAIDNIITENEVNEIYKVGEQVVVFFKESLGFRAMFLGYLLPFLVLMTVLIIGTSIGLAEGTAGLLALGSLVPYYMVIFLKNKKLKKTFSFSIRKIHTDQILRNAEFNF